MKNKTTVSETIREILLLEGYLKELSQLSEEAYTAFDTCIPLDKMNEILESSWKKLAIWNSKHTTSTHFYMQNYDDIQGFFCRVTNARINRDEFAEALKPSCKAIDDCIKKIQCQISAEEKKLDELYEEFAQDTGDLKFIFEAETVKKAIINKLLKS